MRIAKRWQIICLGKKHLDNVCVQVGLENEFVAPPSGKAGISIAYYAVSYNSPYLKHGCWYDTGHFSGRVCHY